ncbi:hypothetical protein BDV06DRAFT_211075 [Aspergillus oleicola]
MASNLWKDTPPPTAGKPYIIPQLSGERLTIPGSKGAFRILASSKQTNGLMAVFQSGAVLSDAPGFHYHNEAHDVFLVTKGYLKLWNGGKCRIMGQGDFAYVPPGVIHNPELLGPHTETYGVVTPGDWVDFFRYISEPYEGVLVPESDDRDLKALLIPKVMAAKGQFDVVFQPNYVPPELGEWDESDEALPVPDPKEEGGKLKEYYLRANTGPRFMVGGVLSRPFITTVQSGGVVSISSIESSGDYGSDANVLGRFMVFEKVDHCLAVLEGTLVVRLRRDGEKVEEEVIREGETVVVPSGQAFALEFRSRFVRVWSFADGDGIEALIERAGEPFQGVILPENVDSNGSCHACLPRIARGLTSPRGRSGLAPRKLAIDAGRRSISVMSFIRVRIARDLEKKIEELNAKLQAAESRLSPRDETPTQINATPSSMPMSTDRPTLTPTSSKLPEDPERSYDANSNDQQDDADPVDDEITEINHHTNGIEFHGSTSSVALLGHLQKARDQPDASSAHWPLNTDRGNRRLPPSYSIVSTLHNASFSPSAHAHANTPQSLAAVHENNYYFEQAHVFMSGYFENVHFIHPFIDKDDFKQRAHDLWFRRTPTPDPSFIALYLAVLSFGALLRVWDETTLGGLTRFEWSRKLFGEAQMYLNYLHFPNNLDAVQCLYLMFLWSALLTPAVAYMYLGLAVRTCLAAGFNRNVRTSSDPRAEWISKTWWGLYSLEIEMSFSLGRPDTLGLDDYHNRPLPPRDDSQHAIIPWMVDFARITRKVSVQIYHRRLSLQEKLTVALAIEAELDAWMAGLPGWIRPGFISGNLPGGTGGTGAGGGRNDLKDPKWARRQRLVLGIRYYNVKTLLFRPFLRHCTALEARARAGAGVRAGSKNGPTATARPRSESRSSIPQFIQTPTRTDGPERDKDRDTDRDNKREKETTTLLSTAITKCLDAARHTISVIHDIYRVHTFFRCWWYNTTYVTFAVSTLLLPLLHPVTIPNQTSTSESGSTSGVRAGPGLGFKKEGPTASTSSASNTEAEKESEAEPTIHSIEKAIAILEATDESVVTRKCAEIIRFYLKEVQARDLNASEPSSTERDRHGVLLGLTGGVGAGEVPAAAWFGGTGAGNGNGFGGPAYGHDGPAAGLGFDFGNGPGHLNGAPTAPGGVGPGGVEFDIPDWAYGFGFPDSSFEGIARFFDDLGGLPILDE